jgi:hypothetical protein
MAITRKDFRRWTEDAERQKGKKKKRGACSTYGEEARCIGGET